MTYADRDYWATKILQDPRSRQTIRQSALDLLTPKVRDRAVRFVRLADDAGYLIVIVETWRCDARQHALFLSGASKLDNRGTHYYGAFDYQWKRGGVVETRGEEYARFSPMLRECGLVSGWDWGAPGVPHSWRDADHAQLVMVADQRRLFSGDWYPDDGYEPFAGARPAPETPHDDAPGLWLPDSPVQVPGAWDGVPYL